MKRILFYLGIVAGIAGLVWFTYQALVGNSKPKSTRGSSTTAVAVEVASITVRDMEDEGRFTGSMIPKSRFVVAPKVAGRLKKLFFDVGDTLSKGQTIAEIEDEEFVQEVAQAEADLAIAKASIDESEAMLEIARREFDRVKAMRQQKVSSEVEVEAALAQLKSRQAQNEVKKAQVLQKESALKTTRIKLSYTKIQAPWDDDKSVRHIGERFVDVGAMLSANTPILSVLDLQTVIAVADVVERDYSRIKVGQTVEIKAGGLSGRIFTGKVARIAPALESTTRQARVEIEVANPDFTLKPGMFVDIRIRFEAHPAVSAIPITALVRREGNPGVFLIEGETRKTRFVRVDSGIVQDDFVEIASPTLNGVVVTMGQHLLEDGSTVLLPGDAEAKGPEKSSEGSEKSSDKPRRKKAD